MLISALIPRTCSMGLGPRLHVLRNASDGVDHVTTGLIALKFVIALD